MGRGSLRIYLGAAPGVGKTVAMLDEAHRRLDRGTDVVVGYVETHGRPHTAALLDGLEVLPRRQVIYRGTALTELDVGVVLARRPQVVLVDELAHTNVPETTGRGDGSAAGEGGEAGGGERHEKRWQDVEQILEAGIDVISTVNIQHLESLNDVVESITGIRQQETVPDEVVRRADQVQVVDMSPEALRRRMAHGNIYGPDQVDAALANYFRVGNLSALREIALLWLADRVDEALERYRADQGISDQWPARERVVVALTGGAGSETLLRRGARIATRAAGGDLIACHVQSAEGLASTDPAALARLRRLAGDLGAEFQNVSGPDVAEAILDHARGVNATQIVVGVSRRSRWQQILRPSIASEVADRSGDIDVHLVPHEGSKVGRRSARAAGLPRRRVLGGLLLAVVALVALTAVLVPTRGGHTLSLDLLLYLALTVVCALVGGIWPALFCAVVGSLVVNWFFTEPRGTLTISDAPNALALAVFVLVAMAVSSVVNVAARRTEQAISAERESSALAAMSRDLLAEPRPLPALLEHARDDLGMRSAVLTESRRGPAVEGRRLDGPAPAGGQHPAGGDDVGARRHRRRRRAPPARRATRRGGGPAGRGCLRRPRRHPARTRTARPGRPRGRRAGPRQRRPHDPPRGRLARPAHPPRQHQGRACPPCVSPASSCHPRTRPSCSSRSRRAPTASTPSSATSSTSPGSRPGPCAPTTTPSTCSMPSSRRCARRPTPQRVEVDLEPDLPLVRADLGLLDRVLANVVENALRHSGDAEVRLTAGRIGDTVQLRVIDRGQGVADADKERIFAAFQRAGDAPQGDGLGLGLAVARGLMSVMGGSLVAEDTPGGGLTMLIELPLSPAPQAAQQEDT